ncbi:hypothetical protein Godav_011738, partial [Gossypium davidsonii]|nr:hypothetical protein [Gossypium davidsonii]MBA0646107.1 hypothetical protein [Gossypium klotzschianum]
MASSFCFLMAVSFLVTTLVIPSSSTIDSSSCQGSMAECMENDEFDMNSDINRRVHPTPIVRQKLKLTFTAEAAAQLLVA